jgi:DNA mismatch repair protein MutS
MYDKYIELYKKYIGIYGNQTAIFLMVGAFYELYDIQSPDGTTECNVKDIVDLLGIHLTTKKDVPSYIKDNHLKTGLFAGVPDYTIHKWAGRLTAAGWTVIVVDQVRDNKGSIESRKVARILSPATHIEALGTADTAYVLGLILKETSAGSAPTFTASAFDLSTGRTYTFDGALSGRGDVWYSDTLTHFMQVFAPRELVIWWDGHAIALPTHQQILKVFGLPPTTAIHIRQLTLGLLQSPLIQDEYLRRLYNIRCALPTQEWLYIQPHEQAGLILLLTFIEEHLPSSFERLERNQRWIPTAAVRLGNAALTQLQMIGPSLRESVLGIFDGCITPMGKRGIRGRILNPINDITELTRRLDRIQALIDISDTDKEIVTALRSIYDIPRMHRRLICGVITAPEIVNLHTSYLAAKNLLLVQSVSNIYKATTPNISHLIANLESKFDIKKAQEASTDTSFFHKGKYQDIDKVEQMIVTIREGLRTFVADIVSRAGGVISAESLSLEDKNGTLVLRGSLKTMKALLNIPEYKAHVHMLKSGGWLEHPLLSLQGYKLLDAQAALRRTSEKVLPIACDEFAVATQDIWRPLEELIECIDIDRCVAGVAVGRGWCRPSFVGTSDAASEPASLEPASLESAVTLENLRHPLIESTLTRTEYVKHSVSLTSNSRGWLIYGMNASGKSSLMKSVGIAVLLAQVGSYIPASHGKIAPFSAIFTRILNQDNLWAGLSSFAVEMSEMREILTYADQNTLVLGDELCSGTESASAHALVAAGIEWLSSKNSKYIFATHLHGLLDILPSPKSLSLAVYHLKVIYDAVADRLVYERTLTSGPGTSLYGLEVAKAMHVPTAYYELALGYRQRFLGEKAAEEISQSTWNSHILRRACELCGASAALEVHHIRQRKDTVDGSQRFADGEARDDPRNLVVVCGACHDAHHAGEVQIAPLKQTSDGPIRQIYSKVDSEEIASNLSLSPPRSRSKWSPEDLTIIETALRENVSAPLKRISVLLKADGITISDASLRSIRARLS